MHQRVIQHLCVSWLPPAIIEVQTLAYLGDPHE